MAKTNTGGKVVVYMEHINDMGYVYKSIKIAEFATRSWAHDFIEGLEDKRTEHIDFRVELIKEV